MQVQHAQIAPPIDFQINYQQVVRYPSPANKAGVKFFDKYSRSAQETDD
jgi:hypothetical protein